MDPKERLRRQEEMQNSSDLQDIFGKLVSGKSGYKAIIEKSKPIIRCSHCQQQLEGTEKFCPECGKCVTEK